MAGLPLLIQLKLTPFKDKTLFRELLIGLIFVFHLLSEKVFQVLARATVPSAGLPTCNKVTGVVVPIPTFPFFRTVIALALLLLSAPIPISKTGSLAFHCRGFPAPTLLRPMTKEFLD